MSFGQTFLPHLTGIHHDLLQYLTNRIVIELTYSLVGPESI